MILADLDLGPNLVNLAGSPHQTNAWSQPGQTVGSTLVYGNRTALWPTGAQRRPRSETCYVEPPNPLGGAQPGTPAALRYLMHQLMELADNPDANPAYVQWRSGNAVLAADPDDGWWIVENLRPDMNTEGSGWAAAEVTASFVAPAVPTSLALTYAGGPLASTYLTSYNIAIGLPIGAVPAYAGTARVGAEGSIPWASPAAFSTSYVPFARPGTVAALWTGGVTIWDTISTGSNPVPTGGAFVNASWVKVYGPSHAFVGDCVLTNGLLLLLFQAGQPQIATVYVWNTVTSQWLSVGTLRYQDNAGNNGTCQEINLDRVALLEGRLHVSASTSAGHWARFNLRLLAGHMDALIEFWPRTQSVTNKLALVWSAATPYAAGFTDNANATTFPIDLAPTTASGYAGAQASASNSPIFGFLYQNPPTTAQGRLSTTTLFGYGDSGGPVVGGFKTYGIFATATAGANSTTANRALAATRFSEYLADVRQARWLPG